MNPSKKFRNEISAHVLIATSRLSSSDIAGFTKENKQTSLFVSNNDFFVVFYASLNISDILPLI